MGEVRGDSHPGMAVHFAGNTMVGTNADGAHRRHNGRPRTIGQLRCPTSPQGCSVICDGGRTAGTAPAAKRSAASPQAGAARLWSVLPLLLCGLSVVRGRHVVGGERGPRRPLGRRARGKRVQAMRAATRSRPAPSAGQTRCPDSGPAHAGKINSTSKNSIPVAAGIAPAGRAM